MIHVKHWGGKMARTIKSIGSAAAAYAAVAVIDRLIPAIAAGLVAMAHELNFDSAQAEAERRGKRCL